MAQETRELPPLQLLQTAEAVLGLRHLVLERQVLSATVQPVASEVVPALQHMTSRTQLVVVLDQVVPGKQR
jgi:hypothetical protein